MLSQINAAIKSATNRTGLSDIHQPAGMLGVSLQGGLYRAARHTIRPAKSGKPVIHVEPITDWMGAEAMIVWLESLPCRVRELTDADIAVSDPDYRSLSCAS